MSGKIAGNMSRSIAAQLPGNGRALTNAMPPNVRQDDSQDDLPCAGLGRAMSAPETRGTTCNMVAQQPYRSPHDGQRDISQATCENSGQFLTMHPKIMNTPMTPTPDLESLRKAVKEFRPNPHRVPFTNLKPVHDSIAELRKQNASYSAIADLLQQHGVRTSRARVAEYGRIVLEGGKSRKRRKLARTAPVANTLVTSQIAPAVAGKPAPPTGAPTTTSQVTPTQSAFASRGPRIAKVEQLPPGETI